MNARSIIRELKVLRERGVGGGAKWGGFRVYEKLCLFLGMLSAACVDRRGRIFVSCRNIPELNAFGHRTLPLQVV